MGTSMAIATPLHFDDVEAGAEMIFHEARLDREDIKTFARA